MPVASAECQAVTTMSAAVRVNFSAAEGETNAIRSAGYVDARNLRDPSHTLIEGTLDD